MILIVLGLAVWGSTLATFLIKTYGGGNVEKNKNARFFFSFEAKTHGAFDMGVWCMEGS